jgi:hypothetical protein
MEGIIYLIRTFFLIFLFPNSNLNEFKLQN